MTDISLTTMLKAGLHFGHKVSKRHPKMDPFIFAAKNGLHIIDLEKSKEQLEKALAQLTQLAKQDKTILFVGTKSQAKDIVKKYAQACNVPYVTERWTGGLITNFGHVSRLMKELTRLKKEKKTGGLKKYTKKEQLDFERKIEKLEKNIGGIEHMRQIPDVIFLIDIKDDKTAVKEANKKGITTFAVVDTNNDPEQVTFPIPGNNDALKAVEYILKLVSEAINEGKQAAPAVAEVKPKEKPNKK